MRRTRTGAERQHRQIATLAREGASRKEIALALGMSLYMVRYHLVRECCCGQPYGARAAQLQKGATA